MVLPAHMAANETGRKLPRTCRFFLVLSLLLLSIAVPAASAQEKPYFVTYDAQMEEPRNLEIGFHPVFGLPKAGNSFVGSSLEFEYGLKVWWTTEFYLDGQRTLGDSTIFTGFRWENRVRPLRGEHWINPVLYVEFENINDADRTLLEVVSFDGGRGRVIPRLKGFTDLVAGQERRQCPTLVASNSVHV